MKKSVLAILLCLLCLALIPAALSQVEGAARHAEGLAAESRGEAGAALLAFLDAAEKGHGPAQKKLGQIYDKGGAGVERDYAESLRWYQRAREQGEDVPTPFAARNSTTVR